jgi:hypothetical protein
MESMVGDDTVRRFFKSVDTVLGAEWIARNLKPMRGALPDRIIMDCDLTVQPRYGCQEGAEIGYNKHEFAVYVTSLPPEKNVWQILQYYRERADTENVFDELKNQWGFSGFWAKSRATTELAARLPLFVYNLWVLFVRFIVPHKHTEAKRGRRWFLLIAARLVQSGRQKEVQTPPAAAGLNNYATLACVFTTGYEQLRRS